MHNISQELIYPELFSNTVSKGSCLLLTGNVYLVVVGEEGGDVASLWLSLLIPNTIPEVSARIRVWVKSSQKPVFPDSYFPW